MSALPSVQGLLPAGVRALTPKPLPIVMTRLTARQREVLEVIRTFIADNGLPPTLREIAKLMGIRSTNAVSDHLRALKRKGHISVIGLKARTIRVLDAATSDAPPPIVREPRPSEHLLDALDDVSSLAPADLTRDDILRLMAAQQRLALICQVVAESV